MKRLLAAYVALGLVAACSGAGSTSPAATSTNVPSGPSGAPAPPSAAPSTRASGSPGGPSVAPSSSGEPTATASPPPTDVPSAAATAPASGAPLRALSWAELTTAGERPGAREDHTWTADGDGSSAYLFGGRNTAGASDELWRFDFDSDTWTRLDPAGARPAARFGHVAVWADGVGLVVWSGQAGASFFADAWAYDPAADAWTELPATGDVPPARYGSCGSVGPDGRLWISHGFTEDAGRFSDTRAYDFASGTWADMTPANPVPVVRCLHDCLWAPDGSLVLYGGQTTGVPAIGDLWSYRPEAQGWDEAPKPDPVARQLYALAAIDDSAFVFGGSSRDTEPLADLWRLDLGGLTWTEQDVDGPIPSARFGAALVPDPSNGRLLLFGGKAGTGELGDLWELAVGPEQGD